MQEVVFDPKNLFLFFFFFDNFFFLFSLFNAVTVLIACMKDIAMHYGHTPGSTIISCKSGLVPLCTVVSSFSKKLNVKVVLSHCVLLFHLVVKN